MIHLILTTVFFLGSGFFIVKNYDKVRAKIVHKAMLKHKEAQVKKWAKAVRKNPSEENKAQYKKWQLVFELLSINRYLQFLHDTGRYSICPNCDFPKDVTYPTCTYCNTLSEGRYDLSPDRIRYLTQEADKDAGVAMIDWTQNIKYRG